ncbi:molecular chaperone [Scandinavium sp. NPDC088450]|uniref:fimbrial biogenesis chaperone n=1 Tax=Scandinavium sp. NPDC088450 TaxID=3364514 RepID=UPI00384F6E6F
MNVRWLPQTFFCAICFAPQAHSAATVLIWPIDPILTADKNATELWIENQGTTATTMQVRIVRWQQESGFERYQQQQDVVASPPILRIDKGGKQLIRLIKQAAVPQGKEQAYRIIVDEIPQPTDTSKPQIGLKLQMRYSIPLFVYGQGMPVVTEGENHVLVSPNNLSWRVTALDGKPAIEVRNRDLVHVRLSNVSVRQGSSEREVAPGLLGYVLPGQTRIWALPAGVTHPTELSATVNAQDAKWQSAAGN